MYIGIDIGTSAVKLLLMKEDGEIVNIVSKEYSLHFPKPGWSEQEPEDWYNAVITGLQELTKDVDKTLIKGISFGGQMHGLVILDENDNVIRPAILWNDSRTVKENDYLNEVVGKATLSKYTANISFTGFTAPKILWVKNNEPENFAKIKKIMLPKDYIAYMLTGVHATDYSDASGMLLLNVENKCWSEQMLDICCVKEEQMPRLYESYEAIGTVKPELAKVLGFTENVVVAAGAGDNAAAAVGTGTIGNGGTTISLGTSGTVFISSREFCVDENNALHAFAHADGGYHLMGCMLSAASCNKWWMEDIIQNSDYRTEQEKIDKLGENHVYFLPYLMGERSPLNDPYARGTFVGMTMDTTRADMYEAVLEGVAFALRQSVDVARSLGIKVNKAKLCGGGAKSILWRRILANVLDLTLEIPLCEEGPAYGGAILAAVACGTYDSVASACERLIKVKETVLQERELVEKYQKRYETFVKIYPGLKEIYRNM